MDVLCDETKKISWVLSFKGHFFRDLEGRRFGMYSLDI